jgi:broad specificity phosphatase PhoE
LLSARLGGLSPTVIWSSEEPKAVETARIVASAFGVAVQATEGLEEHHRTGVGYFPTQEEFELAVEQFFCRRDQLVLGTETAEQALNRFTAAIGEVINAGHQDNIVVTHGTVMTLYLASVSEIAPMDFWRRLGMPSFILLELPSMDIHSVVESLIESQATVEGMTDGGQPA